MNQKHLSQSDLREISPQPTGERKKREKGQVYAFIVQRKIELRFPLR
jgi:hypothetical protein